MAQDSEFDVVKRCTKCDLEKSEEDFYLFRGARCAACRQCKSDYTKLWYKKNREKIRERQRNDYKNSNGKYLQATKEWQKNNPEKAAIIRKLIKARRRCATGSYSIDSINHIFLRQNGCCNYCKSEIKTKYHIDHIIPIKLGGNNYPLNIQLLCPSCNFSKAAKNPLEYEKHIGFHREILYDSKHIYYMRNIDGNPRWRCAELEAF